MAKGDSDKAQNQINQQGSITQQGINQLSQQNTDRTTNFQNLYQPATGTQLNDYGATQSSYDNFLKSLPNSGALLNQFLGSNPASSTASSAKAPINPSVYAPTGDANKDAVLNLYKKYEVAPGGPGSGFTDLDYWSKDAMDHASGDQAYVLQRLESNLQGNGPDKPAGTAQSPGGNGQGAIDDAISGYGDFAKTGGFSDADLANMRARSVAPIRALQDRNNQEIQRQASIRGTGYSPNTAAAIAKSARDTGYAMGDTATNTEGQIAQLKQQGRLYGLGGLASTGLSSVGTNLSNAVANRGLDLNAITSSGNEALGAMNGKTSLYGSTPGLINTFGNQVLNSGAQGIQVGGLQNQLAQAIMNAQLGKSSIPGDFQSAMGNLSSIFNLGGSLVDPLTNLFKLKDTGSMANGPGY